MSIIAFLQALPDLIKLFQLLDQRITEAKTDRKVSDDLKVIHAAFETKDPAKLNALFNNSPNGP